MATFVHALIERDLATGLLVGSVPGVDGAHCQGESVEDVRENLKEVLLHLREQNQLRFDSEFVCTTVVSIP